MRKSDGCRSRLNAKLTRVARRTHETHETHDKKPFAHLAVATRSMTTQTVRTRCNSLAGKRLLKLIELHHDSVQTALKQDFRLSCFTTTCCRFHSFSCITSCFERCCGGRSQVLFSSVSGLFSSFGHRVIGGSGLSQTAFNHGDSAF